MPRNGRQSQFLANLELIEPLDGTGFVRSAPRRSSAFRLSVVIPMYDESDGLDALFTRLMPSIACDAPRSSCRRSVHARAARIGFRQMERLASLEFRSRRPLFALDGLFSFSTLPLGIWSQLGFVRMLHGFGASEMVVRDDRMNGTPRRVAMLRAEQSADSVAKNIEVPR